MEQGSILGGDLETLGLQATLTMLALGGKTGILSVDSGQEHLRIALEKGNILALEEPESYPPDLIEVFRLLRRLARLSRTELAQLRQMSGTNPVTAMAVMEQWQLMTRDEVQQRIEFGIIQAISRAIRWEHGRFEFHRDVSPIQTRIGAYKALNVDHVLLEALRVADERDHVAAGALSRYTVPRWMPRFTGDVSRLGLSDEEKSVLRLANGQLPLTTIAYGLLLPEPHVDAILRKVVNLGLVELVDARLEAELERSLINLLTQSQHALAQQGKASPEQRMLVLVRTLGACVNGLLVHHGLYARALRGRGELPRAEIVRYIEATFLPLLAHLQADYPRMDEIVRFEDGQVNFESIAALEHVVRGRELGDCYWDAVCLFYELTRRVFECVLADEVGQSRVGRQFGDLWAALLHEIDDEMRRLAARSAAVRA